MAKQRAQTPYPVAGGQGQPGVQSNGPRQRILRIGVLLGGNLVEERLIRDRVPVLIGQSTKKTNTFSIPIESLPLEFTLFAIDENKYSLRFLNKMDGRVSDSGGTVSTLEQLKQRGAQNVGDYWQIPLSETSRGKLSLGDLTILFQFVTEPPRQPKPMLPASVRGTFADRFDPRLTVIMAIAILFNFGWTVFFLLQDLPEPDSMAQKAYNLSFKQETVELEEEKKPDVTPADKGSDGSAAEKKPDKTPAKAQPDKTPTKAPANDGGGRKDDANVALKEEEEARAAADALTAFGPNGKSEGDMASRRPGADLGQQINDVNSSGKNVKVGGGTGTGSRNSGDPRVGTGNGPKVNGPTGTQTAGGPKEEHAPTGRITVGTKQAFDDSTLSPDAVLQKIQSQYMAGIQHCYRDYLKKDQTSRGKVILDFTVNETGRLVDGKASNYVPEVTGCIQGLMGSWRFPIPKKDNQPTSAGFRIALQLVPE